MYYLSIGAMFRHENSWLNEWIQYHRARGVEHFYLYNHDPDTHVSNRILKSYSNFVDNIPVTRIEALQRIDERGWMNAVYREMIQNAAGQTKWLALIDLDEFILPKQNDDIRDVLDDYEEHCGLAMNWQVFGSSGYVTNPPTQINHLLYRSETAWTPNRFFKSIVKPDLVIRDEVYDVHHFPCEKGRTVNENHEPVVGLTHDISVNVIQINHYPVRSWQDFWETKAIRPRFNGTAPCDEQYFEFHDRNEVFDDEISRRFGHEVEMKK